MNITLIGMPGVGKSYIGKELAKRLDYEFIDVDEVIEEKTKTKLQDIIDNLGDEEILKIEEGCVLELGGCDNHIISPGGSIVYSPEAMEFLKKTSVVVYLKDSLESIQKRLTNQETRGIVGLKEKGLKALFDERTALYEKYADITVQIREDFNANEVVNNILQEINK